MRTSNVPQHGKQRRRPPSTAPRLRTLRAEQLEDRSLLALVAEMVADIQTGSAASDGLSPALPVAGVDRTAFFAANNGATGLELWKSDVISGETVLVKDIQPGRNTSSPGLGGMVHGAGVLFFSAATSTNGPELWKSDGSEGGTLLVKEITAGSRGSS